MIKFFLPILVFSTISISAQKVEIIDENYNYNGKCLTSFRLKIHNKNSRVDEFKLKAYRNDTESTDYSYFPLVESVWRSGSYAEILPDGTKIYYSQRIYFDSATFIKYSLRAYEKRGSIKKTIWTETGQPTACDFTEPGYQMVTLRSRGKDLQTATENQCAEISNPAREYLIFFPQGFKEGKMYYMNHRSNDPEYYSVGRVYNDRFIHSDFTVTKELIVRGPISYSCASNGGDNGDGSNDTSDFNLSMEESETFVYSYCSDCPSRLDLLNPGFLGGSIPLRWHSMTTQGAGAEVRVTLKNIGNTYSSPSKLRFYLSDDYNSLFGVEAVDKAIDIPSLAPNAKYSLNQYLKLTDFNRSLGKYYLVLDVQPESDNDSNSQNNYLSIPMELRSAFGRIFLNSDKLILDKSHNLNETYNIEIYDLSGNLKLMKNIERGEEINIFNNLEKGLYIIKENDKTLKYYKN